MNLTFVGEFFKIREPKVGPPVHSNLKTLEEKDRNNVKSKPTTDRGQYRQN